MEYTFLKVKSWFIDKESEKASRYNTFFDFKRKDNGSWEEIIEEDGFKYVFIQKVLNESEKAIQVQISTGDVLGSYKGWKVWIPKSLIEF
jgi:hypothetical protein